MRHTILAAGLTLVSGSAFAQTPVLTVYTYDSFIPEWGPGPAIEAAFEETCGCDLQFVGAGDGAALLSRIRLEGARSEADVVLGLDTNLTAAAAQTGLFAEHGVTAEGLTLPVAWDDPLFLPFDWGYFAFVHDTSLADVPGDFEALGGIRCLNRHSGPEVFDAGARPRDVGAGSLWRPRRRDLGGLADNIVTVTPGWSEAYGLFLDGEADMVLSYTTSPAYHLIAEEDPSKAAAAFNEGHYMQIEVAGILEGSDQPDLAREFLSFMLTEAFQAVIPTTNWMYPAALSVEALPDGFDTLITPTEALILSPGDAAAIRAGAIETWQSALSQ
jgi:thiamine transport system substrate-binding protein